MMVAMADVIACRGGGGLSNDRATSIIASLGATQVPAMPPPFFPLLAVSAPACPGTGY